MRPILPFTPLAHRSSYNDLSTAFREQTTYDSLAWQPGSDQFAASVYALPGKDEPALIAVEITKTPLAWSPIDANLLAFGHWNTAIVWDIRHDAPLHTLSVSDAQEQAQPAAPNLMGLTWSPDGRYLAGCYGLGRSIAIWDIATLKRTAPSPATVQTQTMLFPTPSGAGHSLPLTGVSWSPDGRYLASTSQDKTVIVWQVDGS